MEPVGGDVIAGIFALSLCSASVTRVDSVHHCVGIKLVRGREKRVDARHQRRAFIGGRCMKGGAKPKFYGVIDMHKPSRKWCSANWSSPDFLLIPPQTTLLISFASQPPFHFVATSKLHTMKHSKYPESSPEDVIDLPYGISPGKSLLHIPHLNSTDIIQGMCCHFYRSPYRFQDAFVKAIQDDFKYVTRFSTSSHSQHKIVQ